MVFRSVATFERAIAVLNDYDIGFAVHNCHEHQSCEFSLEQHSPLCEGVQKTRTFTIWRCEMAMTITRSPCAAQRVPYLERFMLD